MAERQDGADVTVETQLGRGARMQWLEDDGSRSEVVFAFDDEPRLKVVR